MAAKRKRSDDETLDTDDGLDIYRSEPIIDRKSTFIGFFSPTLKPKDIQNLAEIAKADHRILGWRKESNQQSITKVKQYVSGSDDDGEKYGGKKVENVLNSMQVSGSCVVARWYGGIMLGPGRFNHMECCARDAIRHFQSGQIDAQAKRRKTEEEQAGLAEHTRLAKALVERDQSIEVLRALAAEKEQKVKDTREAQDVGGSQESTKQTEVPTSSAKTSVNYADLPLNRLRALDKARDATLAFLLHRINKAEADLAETKLDEQPP